MPLAYKDLERFLEIGNTFILHTAPSCKNGPRHKTVLRGWRKGAHLLLDRPKTDTGMFVALQEGQPCVFRFLYEGFACAFDAIILDWDTRRSNPYLRVQWPSQIQHLQFRKFERVKIQTEASISYGGSNRVAGEIRDISMGGCGVFTRNRPPEGIKEIGLSFSLPDGMHLENVVSEVRTARPAPSGYFIGCEFKAGQESVENDISFYVTTCLSRGGGIDSVGRSVLVLESESDLAGRIRKNLERQNLDVFVAPTTIDGMCRLRTSAPDVLLISADMKDLPGIETCRLVKTTKDFDDLKVYVYGGDPATIEPQANKLGLDGYFPPSKTLAPDIAFEIGKSMKAGN
ncbi:MAG: PilZ domain-containing protein [Candidatus Hydrogenedentota bacterium]